ncbi:hypothetical protein AB836_00135 [Rickettsiales bacterium (ex Bugula neritina AB1)]|nr:hypothetical protein AB836_00135 [Rickettsiales bacterium (ex Bugula neritina AB1)]
MISSIVDKVFGTKSDNFIKKHKNILEKINQLESTYISLTGLQIREKIQEIRNDIRINNKKSSYYLPEVFALTREAAKRTIGHRHYDVQILGGIALYKNYICEMQTGEGKTLVATLPAVLKALENQVHIVTVNDYLAEIGCTIMGKIYKYLGLDVAFVTEKTSENEEINIFSTKDIVYISNNQIVFRYLKELLRSSNSVSYNGNFINRKFNMEYAIIDEIDNILIDEARTPFIISGPGENTSNYYAKLSNLIRNLQENIHYTVDFKNHLVLLTDEGDKHLEEQLQQLRYLEGGLYEWSSKNIEILHILRNLLKAFYLFRNEIDYIVYKSEIVIIDEFTGRLSEGRRFSSGLHQALEAKENVHIKDENSTLLSTTYTSFFKQYKNLCGMTGTASTEKEEFLEIYELEIITLPTNKPNIRKDHSIRLYKNRKFQLEDMQKIIKEAYDKQQPILIVTNSVQDSEVVSNTLKFLNVKHNVLNAKHHKQEGEVIANAGNLGAVTVATNMAGRGTDIKLGGNVDYAIDKILLSSDEINESNQEEIISEEEVVLLGDLQFNEMNLTNKQKLKIKQILEEYNVKKKKVIDLGGLLVIDFGMKEAEKIRRQSIGRSARQGDPGTSYTLYSLEDDILATTLKGSWNEYIFRQAFSDNEKYINGNVVEGLIKRFWKMISSQHFRVRKDVQKYDIVKEAQKQEFFDYRNYVLSENSKEIAKKIFKVFVNFDMDIDYFNKMKDILSIETKEELSITIQDKIDDFQEEELRLLILHTLDEVWKEHNQRMEDMLKGSYLISYAQKDPYQEYKIQAFYLFQVAILSFRKLFIEYIINNSSKDKDNQSIDLEELRKKFMNMLN